MSHDLTPRRRLGALLRELPRGLYGLLPAGRRLDHPAPWVRVRNRRDRLSWQPGRPGPRCEWDWSRPLLAAQAFPWLGRLLMRRALRDWPLELAEAAATTAEPAVSFLLPHRGEERLPLLLSCLASLAAQRGAAVECVVAEQAPRPESARRLPGWVRHVHDPAPAGAPFNRARACNAAAAAARGGLLVFHDGDLLAPRDYAAELLRLAAEGFEVLDLKRFVFALDAASSRRVIDARDWRRGRPEAVVQNLKAGGSVALRADCFRELGGFDEGFVGWGGEDDELWSRAGTRRVFAWSHLPLLHLWHEAQPEKHKGSPGTRRWRELALRAPEARIAALRERGSFSRSGSRPPSG